MGRKPYLIIIAALAITAVIYVVIGKHAKRPEVQVRKIEVVKEFPFSKEDTLREWEEKIFRGRVLYKITSDDHESFVLATSEGTASALYYKIKLDMKKKPVISWKWDAKHFPVKDGLENLSDVKKDDFAARVYVIFPALFFINSKALEYVWAEKIEEETMAPSPYSKNLRLIVVECGKRPDTEWIWEERDIYRDYVAAFGEDPRYDIGAVAFMTDADSTRSFAEAFYDDIKLGYRIEEAR